MKLSRVRGCINIGKTVATLQFTLVTTDTNAVHKASEFELSMLGSDYSASECTNFEIDESDFVTKMEVGYTSQKVNYIGVISNNGKFTTWGANGGDNKVWNFPTSQIRCGIFLCLL